MTFCNSRTFPGQRYRSRAFHVEESDAGHPDRDSLEVFPILPTHLPPQILEHLSAAVEFAAIRRADVAAEVRIIRLGDDTRARVLRVCELDVDVVIDLGLHASDSADHFIDAKLLRAHAVIAGGTAMGRNGIERADGRLDWCIELNARRVLVAQALDLRPGERTAAHCDGKHNQRSQSVTR